MTLQDVKNLAIVLLNTEFEFPSQFGGTHKLSAKQKGYRFEWGNKKRSAGTCSYSKRVIYLSKPVISLNLDDKEFIRNTLLHEIAHALAGSGHGHNRYWKSVAKAIGCNAKRCFDSRKVENIKSKYTLHCDQPECGRKYPIHRKPKRTYSCECNPNKGYSAEYKLRLVQNY